MRKLLRKPPPGGKNKRQNEEKCTKKSMITKQTPGATERGRRDRAGRGSETEGERKDAEGPDAVTTKT
jgi:hypothetical protein